MRLLQSAVQFSEKFTRMIRRMRDCDIDRLELKGINQAWHYRDGKLLAHYKRINTIMNADKNNILDTYFNALTQIASTAWRIGLISSSGYSAIAPTDTMGSHPGWTEATAYSEATRPAWGQGAAASQAVTNASPATFTANAGMTVKGQFITSNSTIGSTTGRLWAAGLFTAGDAVLVASDVLNTTYSVSC